VAGAVQEEENEDEEDGAEAAINAAIDAAVVAQNPTAPSNVDFHEHDSVTVGTSGVSLTAAAMAAEEEAEEAFRPRVLVVDDSAMNRRMLCRRCVRALPMISPQPLARRPTLHLQPKKKRPHSLLTSVTPVYTNHAALLASLELAGFDTVQADDGLTACAAVSHVDVVRRIGDSKHGTIDHPDAPVAGEDAAPRPALDPFVAILMDSNMPIMSGPNACHEIRQMGYRYPIFGVTGDAEVEGACVRPPLLGPQPGSFSLFPRPFSSCGLWQTSSVRVPTGSCSSP